MPWPTKAFLKNKVHKDKAGIGVATVKWPRKIKGLGWRTWLALLVLGLLSWGAAYYMRTGQIPLLPWPTKGTEQKQADGQGAAYGNKAGSTTGNASKRGSDSARAAGAGQGGRSGGPATVELGLPESVVWREDVQTVGTLRAKQNVLLKAEAAGKIIARGFSDGQAVRKGQMLYQLDNSLQRANIEQFEAQLAVARSNHKRNQELVAQGFISKAALDQNLAAVKVAEAQRNQAQAQNDRLRTVAPFDGVVGISKVQVGDYVREGVELVALEDHSSLMVDFRLSERAQSKLRLGQSLELHFDAMPNRTYTAKVQAIEPSMDETARSLLVRAAINGGKNTGPGGALRPGMFANVTLVVADAPAPILVLPEEVLSQDGDNTVVWVAEPAGQDDKGQVKMLAKRRTVQIGQRRAGKAEILQGIQATDQVVLVGAHRLQGDAAPIRVATAAGPAGPNRGGSAAPGTTSTNAASVPSITIAGTPAGATTPVPPPGNRP